MPACPPAWLLRSVPPSLSRAQVSLALGCHPAPVRSRAGSVPLLGFPPCTAGAEGAFSEPRGAVSDALPRLERQAEGSGSPR